MYTKFSGTDSQSGARWLRTLNYELPGNLTPGQWLECVDGLLEGKAARWADQHPRIKAINEKLRGRDNDLSDADVDIFEKAVQKRFPPAPCGVQLLLTQWPEEDLDGYYERAEVHLHTLGGVDSDEDPAPSEKEHAALVKGIEAYVNGIFDSKLRGAMHALFQKECDGGGIGADQGLRDFHRLSKTVWRELSRLRVESFSQPVAQDPNQNDPSENVRSINANSGGLFGNRGDTQRAGGLFGNTTNPATAPGGLFHNPGNIPFQPSTSLFGNPNSTAHPTSTAPSSGSLFGNLPTKTNNGAPSSSGGSNLFRNLPTTTANTTDPATAPGGLFNNPGNVSFQPPNSLFGSPNPNPNPAASSSNPFAGFGTTTAVSRGSSLFGGLHTSSINPTQSAPGSLFGNCPNTNANTNIAGGGFAPAAGSSLFGPPPSTKAPSNTTMPDNNIFGRSSPSSNFFGAPRTTAPAGNVPGNALNPDGIFSNRFNTEDAAAPVSTAEASGVIPSLRATVEDASSLSGAEDGDGARQED